MSRLSTLAVSTLVPALNVLSTTLPDRTFFSVVRTNAPPLPGLTCWKSTIVHSWPSRLSTRPFFRSFVVATVNVSPCSGCRTSEQVYRRAALPDARTVRRTRETTRVPARARLRDRERAWEGAARVDLLV